MRYPQASGSSRLTRVLGWSALAALALNTWWGLWLSPPDVVQGQFVRMLYIHPAVATMCYAGFGVCALGSIAWLWPRLRSPRWDRLAVAGAEVGAVFCFATLVTGSIWGRASWGVWWTWDARLTLTAILFALSLGYLALRRSIDNPHSRPGVVDGGDPDGLDRGGRPLCDGVVRHPPPERNLAPTGPDGARVATGDDACVVLGFRARFCVDDGPPLQARSARGTLRARGVLLRLGSTALGSAPRTGGVEVPAR